MNAKSHPPQNCRLLFVLACAMVVLAAGREDLVLQVKYEGPVNEFGWLVPVPSVPKVEKGSMACFYELPRANPSREVTG